MWSLECVRPFDEVAFPLFALSSGGILQRFSGRLKLAICTVKIQVEVQSVMTTNYIDAAVYMFCISGHG